MKAGVVGRSQGHGLSTGLTELEVSVRKMVESKNQTPPPFDPLWKDRINSAEHEKVLVQQERLNKNAFGQHSGSVHDHLKNGGVDLRPLFDAPGATCDLNPSDGLLVWHQLSKDRSQPVSAWAYEEHQQLKEGQYVKYQHHRSATIRTWWLGTSSWTAPDIGSGKLDPVMRLELHPKRGMYLADVARTAVGSPVRPEGEIVLPPGFWKVVGVRDLAFNESRAGAVKPKRCYTLLMEEVTEYEARKCGSPVSLTMSPTSGERL